MSGPPLQCFRHRLPGAVPRGSPGVGGLLHALFYSDALTSMDTLKPLGDGRPGELKLSTFVAGEEVAEIMLPLQE